MTGTYHNALILPVSGDRPWFWGWLSVGEDGRISGMGEGSPPADAPAWQARIVATVTMRHGYALLAAPQRRSADAAVVVLARVLADVDAVAGQPYRPVFVQGCSPY